MFNNSNSSNSESQHEDDPPINVSPTIVSSSSSSSSQNVYHLNDRPPPPSPPPPPPPPLQPTHEGVSSSKISAPTGSSIVVIDCEAAADAAAGDAASQVHEENHLVDNIQGSRRQSLSIVSNSHISELLDYSSTNIHQQLEPQPKSI